MATEIKLPRLGQGMEAGTIVRWLKSEGDEVAKGEPLFELDTDKVTQEVEADAAGVLLKIVIPEGETSVGTTVAVIGAADEDVSELLAGAQSGNGDSAAPPVEAPAEEAPTTEEATEEASEDGDIPAAEGDPPARRRLAPRPKLQVNTCHKAMGRPVPGATAAPPVRAEGERVKASPLARRMARERGLDVAALTGTGPEGRIIAEDVEQAADGAVPRLVLLRLPATRARSRSSS